MVCVQIGESVVECDMRDCSVECHLNCASSCCAVHVQVNRTRTREHMCRYGWADELLRKCIGPGTSPAGIGNKCALDLFQQK